MQEPAAFPLLETNRLRLREIVDSDAEDLFSIHGDPKLMQWFGSEPLQDLAAAQALVKTFLQAGVLSPIRERDGPLNREIALVSSVLLSQELWPRRAARRSLS